MIGVLLAFIKIQGTSNTKMMILVKRKNK